MKPTIEAKRIEEDLRANPLFPLPPDYDSLTSDGQRQARTNAVAMWQLGRSPEERARLFVASVRFFDYYYLWPDPEAEFNPLFYDDDPVPESLFHRAMWAGWGRHRKTLDVAPRGSAKSKNMVKAVFPKVLTMPWTVTYATSTVDNAEAVGQWFKDQFLQNERLIDDFSPAFPDRRITPRRGERPFGTTKLYLNNGAWIRMLSVETRQRGGRPHEYLLDDPEYDPKQSTSMEILRAGMERLLFKIVLPMVQQPGRSVHWTATFVSKRHFAWYAMDTVPSATGPRAKDPRFNSWQRTLVKAEFDGADGKRHSIWEDMWPLTSADADAIATRTGRPRRDSLEEIREAIGVHNYNSEYMGSPGQDSEAFFTDPTEEKHGYTIEKPDGEPPHRSMACIRWWSMLRKQWDEKPLHQFLRECSVFQCIDTSWTATSDSDYKVSCLMAATPDNELFVLDLWAMQAREHVLIAECFGMCDRWHPFALYPEVVQQSINLYNALDTIVRQRATEMTGTTWLPKVVPLKIPVTAIKENRIAGLIRRWEHGLIKLPLWRRWEKHWSMLFDQFHGFNPSQPGGGLQHDDAIDTVSMSELVLKGRKGKAPTLSETPSDPKELLLSGKTHHSSGIPLLAMIDFGKLTAEEVAGMLQARRYANASSADGAV